MMTVPPGLQRIAQHPDEIIRQFELKSPSHQEIKTNNPYFIIAGIVASVCSIIIFNQKKPVSFALMSVAALAFYKSADSHLEPTQALTDQIRTINELFDPCIEELTKAHDAKAKAILNAVNDMPVGKFEDVEPLIKKVIGIYDRTISSDQWTGSLIQTNPLGKNEYDSLRSTASQLIAYDASQHTQDETIIGCFDQLKKAATEFLEGRKNPLQDNNHCYVYFGYFNGKASVTIY